MCVSVLPSSMSVHQMHEVHKEVKRGFRSPGSRVTDVFELPCRCQGIKLSPVEEQPVF